MVKQFIYFIVCITIIFSTINDALAVYNTIDDGKGNFYDIDGDRVYGNNGIHYEVYGREVFGSDGSRYDIIGNTVRENGRPVGFISNGRFYAN